MNSHATVVACFTLAEAKTQREICLDQRPHAKYTSCFDGNCLVVTSDHLNLILCVVVLVLYERNKGHEEVACEKQE